MGLFSWLTTKKSFTDGTNGNEALPMIEYNATLNTSLSMISTFISTLELNIVKDDEIMEDDEVLQAIQNKSIYMNYQESITAMIRDYHINGSAFVRIQLNGTNQIIKWIYLPTSQVNTDVDDRFNPSILGTEVDKFSVYLGDSKNISFKYNENGILQNINDKKDYIIHWKNITNGWEFYGTPIIKAINYELAQLSNGAKYNANMLANSGSYASLIRVDSKVPNDVADKFKERLSRLYSGTSNAGRAVVIKSDSLDIVNAQSSNRDMEYSNLQNHGEIVIFRHMGIPLPLVLDSTMTLSNFNSALIAFYSMTAKPTLESLLTKFNEFFIKELGENKKLIIDESAIEVLTQKKSEEINKLAESGIYSINELREQADLAPLADGGDAVMGKSGTTPIGFTELGEESIIEPLEE